MKRLRILTLITTIIAISIFINKHNNVYTQSTDEGLVINKIWLQLNNNPLIETTEQRSPDQTFLTYPEWFLVHSPAEQAAFLKQHTSTKFPFTSHIWQIWESYEIVNDQIKDNFEYNSDYHLMIKVIGVSASVEYFMKAWYERVIGRLTDTGLDVPQTEEDRFNYQFNQDYVDFIRELPWYEFNFKSRLANLWTDTPFFGTHFLRKLERKYYLTSELMVKSAYGYLIKIATKSAFEEAALTTQILIDGYTSDVDDILQVKLVKKLEGSQAILTVPRYAAFSPTVQKLSALGIEFKEIAGNTSALLITVLTQVDWQIDSPITKTLFTQVLPSNLQLKRTAFVTTVPQISKVLKQLKFENIEIEHIYDY
jgi:hypothetical protein